GFVEVLAAQQTNETADWYQGTADAVRQQVRYVVEDAADQVLILSGDQLYRMDFRQLLRTHRDTKADVTLAVLPVPREQVAGFGIMRLDDTGRVIGFVEKPKTDEAVAPLWTSPEWMKRFGVNAEGRPYLASMGIYLFKRQALLGLLNARPPATDFGTEIFPRSLQSHHVQAHLFDGYGEDLGRVKAYHEATLALASDAPPFDFHSPEGIIYTRMRFLPASRVNGATLRQCLISDGCVVEEGARLERCGIGGGRPLGENGDLRGQGLVGAARLEARGRGGAEPREGAPGFTAGG